MPRYAYKLVPAPERSAKHKGLKGAALFAATLESVLNSLGAEGWEYLRAETLPEDLRAGLTSRKTTYRNLLVFRRILPEDAPGQTLRRTFETRSPSDDAPSLANLFLGPNARGGSDSDPKG